MSVIQITVNELGKEKNVIVYSLEKSNSTFAKLLISVNEDICIIYKSLVTGIWTADIKVKDKVGRSNIQAIGFAIDEKFSFNERV